MVSAKAATHSRQESSERLWTLLVVAVAVGILLLFSAHFGASPIVRIGALFPFMIALRLGVMLYRKS